MNIRRSTFTFCLFVVTAVLPAQSPGTEFTSGFGLQSIWAGTAKDTVVHDDGSGPAMYVVGEFAAAGDAASTGTARWRRGRWESVGDLGTILSGTGPSIAASVATFDDGAGPAVYVAVSRFDPASSNMRCAVGKLVNDAWIPVGPNFSAVVTPAFGPIAPYISTLHVGDLGAGPRLFAGGRFNRVGSAVVNCVAQFDGVAWSQVGNGLGPVPWQGLSNVETTVDALEISAADGGAKLYAAGAFKIGSTEVHLARLDGATWTSLGAGSIYATSMRALEAFNDGTGEKLFIGGSFNFVPSVGASGASLLVYDGVGLSVPAVLTNGGASPIQPIVRTIGTRTPAGGPTEIVIAGDFGTINGASATGMALLSGGVWGPFPGWSTGTNVFANIAASFTELDDGDGPRFYYGASHAYDGTTWGPVDRRSVPPIANTRRVLDSGDGPRLYGADRMTVHRREIAGWTQVCSAPPDEDTAVLVNMEMFDEGAGPRLFVAGQLQNPVPGGSKSGLLRYDGSSFSNLGTGIGLSGGAFSQSLVRSLLTADLGAGQRLFVGGTQLTIPGITGTVIAAWDGQNFSELGGGLVGSVYDMVKFDNGTGPSIVVAGAITSAGGVPVSNIARWNGSGWTPLGFGLNGLVLDLQMFDSGAGPQLHAAGFFSHSGFTSVGSVAKWNGTSWVSTGLPYLGSTWTLESYDAGIGGGAKLFAGGNWFGPSGASGGLASFDGTSWTAVPGLSNGPGGPAVWVVDLTTSEDPDRPSLYITGQFAYAGSRRVNGVAKMAAVAPDAKWEQSGPGAPGTLTISSLPPGAQIYNYFSLETTGPFGLGPIVGLYAADLSPLILQATLPPGTEPFQFSVGQSTTYLYGPLLLPVGLRMDLLSISWGSGRPILAEVERIIVK